MNQPMAVDEEIARRVAGATLTDLRTVRKELSHPGLVRGLVGDRIRRAIRVAKARSKAAVTQ